MSDVQYVTHAEVLAQVQSILDECGVTARWMLDHVLDCGCCIDIDDERKFWKLHDLLLFAHDEVRELVVGP